MTPKEAGRMAEEIRGALERHTRDELVEMLTWVFKEYVVTAPVPLVAAAAQVETRSELDGMSFAAVIEWLQQRLDLPELGLFDVSRGRVQLRAGGQLVAIEAPRRPAEPLPPVVPVSPPPPIPESANATVNSSPIVEPSPTVNPNASVSPNANVSANAKANSGEESAEPSSRFTFLEVD